MSKQNTESKILDFVRENYEVSTKDIVEFLGISPQATHKHLKKLVEKKQLEKMGRPPSVFYKLTILGRSFQSKIGVISTSEILRKLKERGLDATDGNFKKIILSQHQDLKNRLKSKENYLEEILSDSKDILENKAIDLDNIMFFLQGHFIYITAEGDIYEGIKGFLLWCHKRNLPFSKTFLTYWNTVDKYTKFKTEDNGLVIATDKFKTSFKKDIQVDEVYYCDFYSIEIFGKTKLGALLLHGKQAQNSKIIHQVCYEVRDRIVDFIDKKKIDAVAFIPPTTPRKPQFMDEFRKNLDLKIPIIKLEKIINDIAIAQKTLKSGEDRIENARNTIFIDDKRNFKNILLLDDAVGSGSTFNEIARKIRKKKLLKTGGKIFALAIVGSANGIVDNSNKFEIINEV